LHVLEIQFYIIILFFVVQMFRIWSDCSIRHDRACRCNGLGHVEWRWLDRRNVHWYRESFLLEASTVGRFAEKLY